MAREYKDSGIEWIGQIPKEWKVNKGKQLYRSNDGGVWGEDATGTNDTIVLRSTEQDIDGRLSINEPAMRHLSEIERQNAMLKEGDLIITKSSGSPSHIGKTSIIGKDVASMDCCFSNFIQRIRIDGIPQYYWYVFNSFVVKNQFSYLSTTTTGINNINAKTLDQLQLLYPPLSEQQKIADYLDKICGEVDEMVTLQETMIEELKAYKQSVITEAVTKGLNPNTPMRNSGIDWIGDIPEHWEAKKLKYIIDYIESGTSVNAGNVPAQTNEFGVLKTSAVSKYVFDATENKTVVSEEMDKVSCPVRKNTIIVSRMNTPELVGACGYVENDYNNIFLPDRLWQVHFVDTVYVKYIWYALRGSNIRNYYSSLSVGSSSSMQNISQSQFSNGSIPIPCDVDEQRAIVSYLDTKCSEIDSLIALKQAKIEELKEYKKSVIYEYVTGKKEVI